MLAFFALTAVALAGVPVFIVLGAFGLVYAWHSGVDPAVLPSQIVRLAESSYLMAIPLFTLTGVILSRGGAP